MSFVFTTLSDHYKQHAIIVIQYLMTISSMLLAIYAPQNGVRYFARYFSLV
jgi:hypothetical protein